MRNRFILLGIIFCLFSTYSFAQSGKLTGTLKDRDTKSPISGAQVKLMQNGERKANALTDDAGYFAINPIDPGTYDLQINYIGYDPKIITGIKILANKTTDMNDIPLNIPDSGGTPHIIIQANRGALNVDNTTTGQSMTAAEFGKIATESVNGIVQVTAGVQTAANGDFSVKGSRLGDNKYIVDGVPVGTGALNLPKDAIENIDIITGGIPAEYGDLTGGVISITTKGPSAHFIGSLDGLTSQFIDPYGYNLVQGSLTGPIIKKKGDQDRALLGFALSGSYNYQGVYNPPGTNLYQVNSDVLSQINANPVRQSPSGVGYVSNAAFVTLDQMHQSNAVVNNQASSYAFSGKIDFQPTDNVDFTLGGTIDNTTRNAFIYEFSLFDAANNPQVINNDYTAFARFRQNFKSDPNAVIQDAYYTIEFSYTNKQQVVQDPRLQDDYFGYGYIGSFKRTFTPQYKYDTSQVNGKKTYANYLQGYAETAVTFTPGGLNTGLENYDKEFFALNGGSATSFNQIQANGGYINGQNPVLVNSMWSPPGTNYSQYQKTQNEQYDLNASGSATISKKHTIKFGIEYQENVQRSFTVGGNFNTDIQELWTLARGLLNNHLTQLSTTPIPVYSNNKFTDTVNYLWQIAPGVQSNFDKNFRSYLINEGARDDNGKLIDQQTVINLDEYKPSDLKLSYFSPDELLNKGNSLVNVYGYDYQGNKLLGKQSIANFLDPLQRAEGAFNPIYTAGYIQDKFELKDIKFNIGLRVDRYDANQLVLADPYSLFPIKTAGEVTSIHGIPVTIPANIGSNYYVYVDNVTNPTKIVGYRNGNTWYDANGVEQLSATGGREIALATRNGTIAPYLENNTQTVIAASSFTNYVPQVNLLPRISFSFPISEVANFYANYNVLTIRPGNNIGALDYYYYINTRSTYTIPNPNLTPETRINYEIGFKQKISDNAFLSFSGYYGLIKNLVEVQRYSYAYPVDYTSYANIDFGTVKGLTLGFDTRHSAEHPVSGLTMSANYTLQFADGTGSAASTESALISAGFANLRTTFPLDYDTRHQINCIFDYRFGEGPDYVGPISANGTKWLSESGINLLLTTKSGLPYTGQANVISGNGNGDIQPGLSDRSTVLGTINGQNMPWQFRADLRVDKNFHFKGGKTKNKDLILNVYVQVQNLFNDQNIIGVYKYTGLPNQDGYLQSPAGKSQAANAASEQAFIDQYNVKLNDPANYVLPRLTRIGASINF